MPVRNLWSLEPGECIVAEELLSKSRDVEVFFPVHDVSVDLLVVRGARARFLARASKEIISRNAPC